jgi:hypothetical protein
MRLLAWWVPCSCKCKLKLHKMLAKLCWHDLRSRSRSYTLAKETTTLSVLRKGLIILAVNVIYLANWFLQRLSQSVGIKLTHEADLEISVMSSDSQYVTYSITYTKRDATPAENCALYSVDICHLCLMLWCFRDSWVAYMSNIHGNRQFQLFRIFDRISACYSVLYMTSSNVWQSSGYGIAYVKKMDLIWCLNAEIEEVRKNRIKTSIFMQRMSWSKASSINKCTSCRWIDEDFDLRSKENETQLLYMYTYYI